MESCRNIAGVLLRAQKAWGVSRNEFAKRLEIARSTLQKYLAAEDVCMRTDTIAHLAKKLGVSEISLISGTAFSESPDSEMCFIPCNRVVKLRRRSPRHFLSSLPVEGGDSRA